MTPTAEISFEMTELLRLLEKSNVKPAQFGMKKERSHQFVDDSWLTVGRSELHLLFALATQANMAPLDFMRVRSPHPIWDTFRFGTPAVFRGRTKSGRSIKVDVDVQQQLARDMRLEFDEYIYEVGRGRESDFMDSVAHSMETRNCIFLGGPKYNPFTEVALSKLWKQQPFDPTATVPVLFNSETDHQMNGPSSFCRLVSNDHPHGIEVIARKGTKPVCLKTDREKDNGCDNGWDAGVLVVARRPFGPGVGEDVTTIVIAGHQAPATIGIVGNLIEGLPYVGEMQPGQVLTRVFLTAWVRSEGKSVPAVKGQLFVRPEDVGTVRKEMASPPKLAKRPR